METVGMDFAEMIMPFGTALLALVITLMFKDYATGIAKGLKFRLSRDFQEGDKVILDGERALIVKIGNSVTVFGDYCWRYVPNERIATLKLEKIIFDTTPMSNGKRIDKNSQLIDEHINGNNT
jgi:small-conductance mechanosensitive channel